MPSTTASSCPWPWAMASISWSIPGRCPPPTPEAVVEDECDRDMDFLREELRAADVTISTVRAELETYKRLYGELLDRVVGGAA